LFFFSTFKKVEQNRSAYGRVLQNLLQLISA